MADLGTGTPLGEDALYEALAEARADVRRELATGEFADDASRALLEAARLIRKLEWQWFEDDDTWCTVGRWVRAAERAGL